MSRTERLWRWIGRNPIIAVLLATLAFVLIGGLSLVTWLWRGEARAANVARQEKEHADQARHEAERWAARSFADLAINQGDHGNVDRALHLFARSLELAIQGGDRNLEDAIRLNLTAWRGQLLRKGAELPHGDWVWAATYSPDGKRCATASRDRTARLWDTATGTPLSESLPHEHPVWAVAFSPDGSELLTGSGDPQTGAGEVRRWQVPTGQPLAPPLPADVRRFVTKLAYSRDGRTILVVDAAGAHVSTNGAVLSLPHPVGAISAALSPDGRAVLTGGADGTARLWDVVTAAPIGAALDHSPAEGLPPGQDCRVEVVAFSPDGALILTGTKVRALAQKRLAGGEVRLWRTRTGEQVGSAWPHPGPVKTIAFSPDGRRALTGGLVLDEFAPPDAPNYRGAARLWDVTTGQPIGPAMEQSKPIWAAAFSPDGRVLLTGSEGGEVQFWRTATCLPLGAPQVKVGNVNCVVFSPCGRTALTTRTYEQAAATLWEVPHSSGDVMPSVSVPGSRVMAFAPDGSTLVTGSADGTGRLWNMAGARPTFLPLRHEGRIGVAVFRSDGRMLATGGADLAVRLWDPATGKPRGQSLQQDPAMQQVAAIAFSPDGSKLMVGGNCGTTTLWDIATGQPVDQPLSHVGWIVAVAFHPDGKTFVVGCDDSSVPQWDTITRLPRGVPFRHQRGVTALAYSPDGATLATGSVDQTAMLWSPATGLPLSSPLQHQGVVSTAAFSPDGKLLLTACTDRSARLWDVASGLRVGPLLIHLSPPLAAFRPRTNEVATIAEDGLLRLWDLPVPAAGAVPEIGQWVEALTGQELADKGVLRKLEPDRLQRLRQSVGGR